MKLQMHVASKKKKDILYLLIIRYMRNAMDKSITE